MVLLCCSVYLAEELQQSVQGILRGRFLAPLAPVAVDLASRLPVHPAGGNREGSIASYTIVFIFFVFIALIVGDPWLTLGLGAVFGIGFIAMRKSAVAARWVNTNINLMLTMVLGGLWHGSSWNFVTWGTLNGVGLVVYKNWKKISPWATAVNGTTGRLGWR